MPTNETGKQRAKRIDPKYYTQTDFLERWKNRLAVLAAAVTVLITGTGLALNKEHEIGASRGPVASVHQSFGSQCSACHVNFSPISSHSFMPDWFANFAGIDRMSSVKKCQECHIGPKDAAKPYQSDHHTGQSPSLACASCHRDHQGADVSLVRIPDSDCTQCHKDLTGHVGTPFEAPGGKIKNVTRFGKEDSLHPPFRSVTNGDPGKLKFSHKQHLTPGLSISDDKGNVGGPLKLLRDIPEELRHRYEGDKEGNVTLNCASCHQLDSGNLAKGDPIAKFPNSLLGQRNAGAYMLPVTFENHCQACHPLTLKVSDQKDAGHLTIPHRMPVNQIHDLLRNFFTAQVAEGKAKIEDQKEKRIPLPGKPLSVDEQAKIAAGVRNAEEAFFLRHDDKKMNKGIRDAKGLFYLDKTKVAGVEKTMYLGRQMCAECHHFDKNVATAIKPGVPPDLHIEPVQVPTVWFKHAKFNHTSHRAMKCVDCHNAEGSTSNTDVLIPNRENCVQCHAPTTKAGTPGVRFQCTECHTYHNRETQADLLQGVGAKNRDPHTKRTIDGFLRNEGK